jgi:hypothetical protein
LLESQAELGEKVLEVERDSASLRLELEQLAEKQQSLSQMEVAMKERQSEMDKEYEAVSKMRGEMAGALELRKELGDRESDLQDREQELEVKLGELETRTAGVFNREQVLRSKELDLAESLSDYRKKV